MARWGMGNGANPLTSLAGRKREEKEEEEEEAAVRVSQTCFKDIHPNTNRPPSWAPWLSLPHISSMET